MTYSLARSWTLVHVNRKGHHGQPRIDTAGLMVEMCSDWITAVRRRPSTNVAAAIDGLHQRELFLAMNAANNSGTFRTKAISPWTGAASAHQKESERCW